MPEFIDYDEFSGLKYSAEFNPDGSFRVFTEQDVTPLLERNQRLRNEGICDAGLKGEYFWYASVPNIVKLLLRERGYNFYTQDPTEQKKIRKIIETDYPFCKTSYYKHV